MSYVTKVYFFGAPEVVIDASAVPEPMRVYLYMMLGNFMPDYVYPRIELIQYPSWVTPTTFEPYDVPPNSWITQEVYFDALPSQDSDFQSYGEKAVTLIWRVRFFQDFSRTQLLSEALSSVSVNFINPNHSSWTRVLFMPFWSGCLPYDDPLVHFNIELIEAPIDPDCQFMPTYGWGLTTDRFTSPYHGFNMAAGYGTGGSELMTLNVKSSYSRCFMLFDLYSTGPEFMIKRDSALIKHCRSPFKGYVWLSYGFRVFPGLNEIWWAFRAPWGWLPTVTIDDVTVVCK